MKLAIILFNLGGPDSPEAVEPFLRNLFSDPAIIRLPWPLRKPLAWFIAKRRGPFAQKIYAHLGGRSPILEETQKQARALEAALSGPGLEARAFVAMRCWNPFSDGAALAAKKFAPDRIVALPLYPQYSTTTSASSLKDWDRAARKAGLSRPTSRICCYPYDPGFIAAMAAKIRAAMADARPGISYRLLLSAHGLPKNVIADGDPYQWQVERTAAALVDELRKTPSALRIASAATGTSPSSASREGEAGIAPPLVDWRICYQSRVGPRRWLEPATDAEIAKAGREGLGVIVAPIAFVSEHSETLVELDIEYEKLARAAGVPDYRRAATVGADPLFIAGLAGLVRKAMAAEKTVNSADARLCPEKFCRCFQE